MAARLINLQRNQMPSGAPLPHRAGVDPVPLAQLDGRQHSPLPQPIIAALEPVRTLNASDPHRVKPIALA